MRVLNALVLFLNIIVLLCSQYPNVTDTSEYHFFVATLIKFSILLLLTDAFQAFFEWTFKVILAFKAKEEPNEMTIQLATSMIALVISMIVSQWVFALPMIAQALQ